MGTANIVVTVIVAVLGSTGLSTLIQFLINRHDKRKDDNLDVLIKIDTLGHKIDSLENRIEETNATQARIRILSFSDELRHGVLHSKESFDQVNSDIDEYRKYCREHRDYENNRSVMAIANIEAVYAERLDRNDFLI